MKSAAVRIGAIARKEFKHLIRDPRILAAVLIVPIVQLLLFAYAISFDVKNVPTVVLDQDKTPASRQYVQAYQSSEFFNVLGEVADLSAVDRQFDRNLARIAVVIPSGFERALASGEKAQVAVLIDGSEPNSAQIGQAYTVALNRVYGQKMLFAWADRQGLDVTQFGQLQAQVRTWYNPEKRSSDFLIPGLMVVIIMIVTVQQTAVTLVRERDQGTQEQLAVSPLRRVELMVGKLLPWTVLAFLDMGAITAVGIGVFGVPLRGSVAFLSVSAIVFVAAALGMGLIISALAPSLETANITALLISFLPAFMLSGFAFPLESIPRVLQWVSYAFPGRYMIAISRGVFLKGAGFAELWPQLLYLSIFAIVVTTIASVLYGRRSQ
ncbi:MAG: ABC transporter permease [Coriobacteriia bacterium]|nr:ABC transporter permease [Coriobacteriia bacterium]